MKFQQTIDLTSNESQQALAAGSLHLQRGQWVTTQKGKGRFVEHGPFGLIVSYTRPDTHETMRTQTQRFTRAVWHRCRKAVSPTVCILGAPSSVPLSDVKDAVRALHVGHERRVYT